jgi:hypothetical protein
MNVCRAWLVALLLGCGAQADEGVRSGCIIENPPPVPFDVGDVEGVAQPAPVPNGTPIVQQPPTAADIAEDCRSSGGSGCDEGRFISKDAATCLAQASELAEGIRDWRVSLGYYSNHQRVGWGIITVRESTPDGYWGEALVLDATTGEELARTSYTAQF